MTDGGHPAAEPAIGPLTAPSRVAALLERHALTPDKGYGQNFLVDRAALRAILAAAGPLAGATVLEVGPGLGVLTRELAAASARVVAVELDARLLPVLRETLAGLTNVELVQGDALEVDLAGLPAGSLLVANLPYNVATPLLLRALASGRFERLVVLVQREVADRLGAAPATPAYGALSLVVRHYGVARSVRRVPPGAFFPPPKVTSSIVRIDVEQRDPPPAGLFELVHAGFAHRRKTLLKNLTLAGYDRSEAAAAIASVELDPRVRAEALDLDTFARLLGVAGPPPPRR